MAHEIREANRPRHQLSNFRGSAAAGLERRLLGFACTAPFRCGITSLADYHQACTRMLRADYCGDGTPHTVDGTLINIYDGIGIQRDTDDWAFEAEWTTTGARCSVPSSSVRRMPFGHTPIATWSAEAVSVR